MRLFFSLVLAVVLSQSAWSDQSQPASDAQLLSGQFAGMESMRANFIQQIHDEKGELLQEASGNVVVKRPRQFYWQTTQPYEHLVVADGKIIWLYDKDLEQVTRQPFTDDLDRAPALILSGDAASLVDQYTVTSVRSNVSGSEQITFTLIPRRSDNVFRKLTLQFESGKITSMAMEDSFQQLTTISFSRVEYNAAIDSKLFHFTPPAGIDVIDNEP